jgi:hypothetical protein
MAAGDKDSKRDRFASYDGDGGRQAELPSLSRHVAMLLSCSLGCIHRKFEIVIRQIATYVKIAPSIDGWGLPPICRMMTVLSQPYIVYAHGPTEIQDI